jgi:hypothetical protein
MEHTAHILPKQAIQVMAVGEMFALDHFLDDFLGVVIFID